MIRLFSKRGLDPSCPPQLSNVTRTIPVIPISLRHRAQSARTKRNKSHSQKQRGIERNQDKLLGPRDLKRDSALTTLHIKTKSLKYFEPVCPNLP
jgi:hypothetical protein